MPGFFSVALNFYSVYDMEKDSDRNTMKNCISPPGGRLNFCQSIMEIYSVAYLLTFFFNFVVYYNFNEKFRKAFLEQYFIRGNKNSTTNVKNDNNDVH